MVDLAGMARSVAEQALGSARAVVELTRSGVLRPIRPDRLAGMGESSPSWISAWRR